MTRNVFPIQQPKMTMTLPNVQISKKRKNVIVKRTVFGPSLVWVMNTRY